MSSHHGHIYPALSKQHHTFDPLNHPPMFRYRFFWWHIQVSRPPEILAFRPIQKEVHLLPSATMNFLFVAFPLNTLMFALFSHGVL